MEGKGGGEGWRVEGKGGEASDPLFGRGEGPTSREAWDPSLAGWLAKALTRHSISTISALARPKLERMLKEERDEGSESEKMRKIVSRTMCRKAHCLSDKAQKSPVALNSGKASP